MGAGGGRGIEEDVFGKVQTDAAVPPGELVHTGAWLDDLLRFEEVLATLCIRVIWWSPEDVHTSESETSLLQDWFNREVFPS